MLNVTAKRCRALSQRFQHIDAFPVRKSTIPERFYKNWGRCWFGQLKWDLRTSRSGWPAYFMGRNRSVSENCGMLPQCRP